MSTWRLLHALHARKGGQLSQDLSHLHERDLSVIRNPDPEVFQVLDPRPLLDNAAEIAARLGGTGFLIAGTIAAGLSFGRQLWFGMPSTVGQLLSRAANALGISIVVVTDTSATYGEVRNQSKPGEATFGRPTWDRQATANAFLLVADIVCVIAEHECSLELTRVAV
jgi:hypothetical protein